VVLVLATSSFSCRSVKTRETAWLLLIVRGSIALAAGTAVGVATEGGSSEVQPEGACDLIVSVETQATSNFSCAQSNCVFCMDAAVGNSVSVEDALSAMAVEISDLDFDDTPSVR
jgi:hypothetical protein